MVRRHGSRHLRPSVLSLETRSLLTVISPLAFNGAGLKLQKANTAAIAKVQSAAQTGGSSTSENSGQNPNPGLDLASLTAAGRARAKFIAKASGPIAVGQPSYVNTGKQVFYIGDFQSNQLLHGTMVMRLDISPTGVVTGTVNLRDRSIDSTGTQIVLNLTGTASDAQGRPTRLIWNVDGSSGAAYSMAPGQGTLAITYRKSGHSKNSAGGATSVFQGLILPSSLGSNINYDLPKFS